MAVFSLLFVIFYTMQGQLLVEKDNEIVELRTEKERVEMTNKELARKIEFTKTDAYVERVAHEELGLLKPGEMRLVGAGF